VLTEIEVELTRDTERAITRLQYAIISSHYLFQTRHRADIISAFTILLKGNYGGDDARVIYIRVVGNPGNLPPDQVNF
jgi:hypothetical protein